MCPNPPSQAVPPLAKGGQGQTPTTTAYSRALLNHRSGVPAAWNTTSCGNVKVTHGRTDVMKARAQAVITLRFPYGALEARSEPVDGPPANRGLRHLHKVYCLTLLRLLRSTPSSMRKKILPQPSLPSSTTACKRVPRPNTHNDRVQQSPAEISIGRTRSVEYHVLWR